MSVVACRVTDDKIEIASDSIIVRSTMQSKGNNINTVKLFKVNDMIIGYVGYAEDGSLMRLFSVNHKPKQSNEEGILEFIVEYEEWKDKKGFTKSNDSEYIIVYDGKAWGVSNYYVRKIVTYDAIGAGRDYALAVLHLGKGVKDAVDVATELSIYCEKPIIYYEENIYV